MVVREILEKINVGVDEEAVGSADLIIESGQIFTVLLTNEAEAGRSFFGCPAWTELAQVCGFQLVGRCG